MRFPRPAGNVHWALQVEMGENSPAFTTSGPVLPHLHSAAEVQAKSEWMGLLHMVPHLHMS